MKFSGYANIKQDGTGTFNDLKYPKNDENVLFGPAESPQVLEGGSCAPGVGVWGRRNG